MNKILHISQSPLQLINNIEASLKLEHGKGKHIIFLRDKQSEEAIKSIVELFNLKNYELHKLNKKFKLLFPLLLWGETKVNYQTIYFGNTTSYTSFLINKINPKRLIHVDDGTRTISLLQLKPDAKFFKSPFIKSLDKNYLKRSSFFTYYSLHAREAGKPYVNNDLSEVSRKLSKLKKLRTLYPAKPNQKIFIGTNILGTYIGIEDVFDHLNKKVGLKDCIYLMHRYDHEPLVESLAQKYGFNAYKINLPIEAYFGYLWNRSRPSVWTFGSTAIDTLSLISPDTHFDIMMLDTDGFTKPGLGDSFQSLYQHFGKSPKVRLHNLSL